MTRTALYRHFDAAGALLYVGISLSAVARLAQHKATAAWFSQIARVDVEWLPTRRAAELAERRAIADENPAHNRARPAPYMPPSTLSPPPSWQGWQIAHPASGRIDGNYFDEAGARDQHEWWCSAFPGERFELRPAVGPARPELRAHASDEWRSPHERP